MCFIQNNSRPFNASCNILHTSIEALHHLSQRTSSVSLGEVETPRELIVPIVEMHSISEVILGDLRRERLSEVFIHIDGIEKSSELSQIHSNCLDGKGSCHFLEKWGISKNHLIVVGYLLLDIFIHLYALIGAFLYESGVELNYLQKLPLWKSKYGLREVIFVIIGRDVVLSLGGL